ncbi:Zinc finger protein PLAGL1 [Folsomia candida]|uniref:Zinc finger protein PLAGL1 n=1 Tax=Folsomia candida TaxID=158441 RepID=A0A226DJN4_FOLCA|nr:Zinc finger protein PLAGL1 [Folsomia candida]
MDLIPGKEWECAKCSKTFDTFDVLARHVVTHDPNATLKCEVCSKICKIDAAYHDRCGEFTPNGNDQVVPLVTACFKTPPLYADTPKPSTEQRIYSQWNNPNNQNDIRRLCSQRKKLNLFGLQKLASLIGVAVLDLPGHDFIDNDQVNTPPPSHLTPNHNRSSYLLNCHTNVFVFLSLLWHPPDLNQLMSSE